MNSAGGSGVEGFVSTCGPFGRSTSSNPALNPTARETCERLISIPVYGSDAMVFKKITLIGRSNENFEDAVEDAIDRAEQTLENLMWVSVVNEAVELDRTEREYQAEVEVAFELQDGVDE